MGDRGKRRIKWISDDAVLLSDTYEKGNTTVRKTKLVRLSPGELRWVSTHVRGPNMYSQFIYQISPEGSGASHLEFTGLHIEYTKEITSPKVTKALTDRILKEDSGAWRLLAKEMERDLAKGKQAERSVES